MGEQAPDPTPALVQQVRLAAQAFAAGRDGIPVLPPELRAPVALWQLRLQSAGEVLDLEAWLLGLLTLARLVQRDLLPDATPSNGSSAARAEVRSA